MYVCIRVRTCVYVYMYIKKITMHSFQLQVQLILVVPGIAVKKIDKQEKILKGSKKTLIGKSTNVRL